MQKIYKRMVERLQRYRRLISLHWRIASLSRQRRKLSRQMYEICYCDYDTRCSNCNYFNALNSRVREARLALAAEHKKWKAVLDTRPRHPWYTP